MTAPPLREISKIDLFQIDSIKNELLDFQFNYFYTGKILGDRKTRFIELQVTTYLTDNENLFIRYATYSGNGKKWKETIIKQIRELMYACNISKEIANGQLRFIEIDYSKQMNKQQYEKAILELKSKLYRD